MKTIKYYHKNSNIIAYQIAIFDDCYWDETYDENGNQLTYRDSEGNYRVKRKEVTKEEFEAFVNTLENSILSKIIELENKLAELGKQLKELKESIK